MCFGALVFKVQNASESLQRRVKFRFLGPLSQRVIEWFGVKAQASAFNMVLLFIYFIYINVGGSRDHTIGNCHAFFWSCG